MLPLTDSESEGEKPFTPAWTTLPNGTRTRRWKRRSQRCKRAAQDPVCTHQACRSAADPGPWSPTTRGPGEAAPSTRDGILEVVMEDEVNGVKENVQEWEEVEFIVDSGASGAVIGEYMIGAVAPSDPDPRKSYKLADGSVIPDKGSKKFLGVTEEGWGRTMTAHVTNVDRPC